MRIFL